MKTFELLILTVLATLPSLTAGQQISSGCNDFLENLDADPTLQRCTSKLLNLTSAFNPTTSSNNTRQPSLDAIQSTLISVCQSTVEFCDMPTMATVLNAFAGNCTPELTGTTAVPSVVSLYDAIYLVKPLKNAMCTTNSKTGNSCMLEIAGSANASVPVANDNAAPQRALSDIAPANSTVRTYAMLAASFDVGRYASEAFNPANLYVQTNVLKSALKKRWDGLVKRQQDDTNSNSSAAPSATGAAGVGQARAAADDPTAGIVTANATTFVKSNLPYLFLSPAMPAAQLCQPCTQAVMASYIAFENAVPYVGGLPKSYLLANQATFWKAIGTSCGQSFLSEINTQAGASPDASSGALGSFNGGAIALGAGVLVASWALLL